MPFGVNQSRRGLLCRLPADQGQCNEAFLPYEDTLTGIADAALERNAHERAAHGYTHVVTSDFAGNYTGELSKNGRSQLGKRAVPRWASTE